MPEQRPILSAVHTGLQSGQTGQSFLPSTTLQPIWGRILELPFKREEADYPEHFFHWEQVIRTPINRASNDSQTITNEGKWDSFDRQAYLARLAGSEIRPAKLLNPAVEINEHSVQVGAVVRLYPSEAFMDSDGELTRHWLFSWQKLRAFRVKYLYVCGTTGPDPALWQDDDQRTRGMPWSEVDPEPLDAEDGLPVDMGLRESSARFTGIEAVWLDDVEEEVLLYPKHAGGFSQGDHFHRFGIARGRTDYSMGTVGWAVYVPHGTQTGWDNQNDPVWRGEWQIVRIDSETIANVYNRDGTIQPNEMGVMWTREVVKDDHFAAVEPDIDETISSALYVFNDSRAPITVESIHKVEYNRTLDIWLPLSPMASSHGISVYADTGVNVPDANWVVVPFNQQIEAFGEALIRNGSTIKNDGEVDLICRVSWNITGRRRMIAPMVAPAQDVDSRMQIALFLNGNQVVGVTSEITSSRRVVADEGPNACNHGGGNTLLTIPAGEAVDVRLRTLNQDNVREYWTTNQDVAGADFTDEMCHLTVESSVSVYRE